MKNLSVNVTLPVLEGDGGDLPFLRSPYNYDRDMASFESGLECKDPSRTTQDGKSETDINEIVKRFGLTGKLPLAVNIPQYGDFEGIFDFQGALNAVMAAEDNFARLPAPIRSRFHNDPALFVDFFSKEENREEALKMGLLEPVAPVPPVVEGVPPG